MQQGSFVSQSWAVPLVVALVWGLSPFWPEPHLVEKLAWLQAGRPFRTWDSIDLLLHAAPWGWFLWTFLADWARPESA